MPLTLLELFPEPTVIPVVTVDKADDAVAVASALQDGGLRSIELTLRKPGAWEAAAAVRAAFPDILLGIGTVTHANHLERAVEIGAQFAVSPGLTDSLAHAGRELDIAYLPGIATASELMTAADFGYHAVKVFPAERLGGTAMIRQFSDVFPHMRFCPSGGVRDTTLADYLSVPAVFAAGGTWLAPAADIAARDWPGILARAQQAADICLHRRAGGAGS
ncbi:MAG: bifunctional 4-hydroxy-2-oxoglutarate aldolase/2-dehydro-3-deoxy-phosphogluconate aldolase [Chromatiales bacterium]|nr:MAG: bifunctional 4-hydroxy-2-oxoglutarate aldolase/2-dehydro-3-deoxy-phosphogluconate aldolase [Chromatiales bacterium]